MGAYQRNILFVSFLAVAILTTILFTYYFSVLNIQKKNIEKEIVHAANIRFDALQDAVDRKLDQVAAMATATSTIATVKDLDREFTFGGKTESFDRLAEKAMDQMRFLATLSNSKDVFFINKKGDVILSLKQNPPYDHNLFESIFQNLGLARAAKSVLNGAQTTLSPFELRSDFGPQLSSQVNIPSAYFVAPIMEDNLLMGALALHAWPENLYTITSNARDISEHGIIAVFAFSESEVVLLNSLKPDFPLNAGDTLQINKFDSQGSVNRVINGLSGFHLTQDIFENKPRYEAYRSMPDMRLGILISVPEEIAYQNTWQIVQREIIIGGVVIVIIMILAYILLRNDGHIYASVMNALREAYEKGVTPKFPEDLRRRFPDIFVYLDGILRHEDTEKHKRERALVNIRTREHAEAMLLDAIYVKAYQALDFASKRNKVLMSDSDLRSRVEGAIGLSQQQIHDAMSLLEEAKDLQLLITDELVLEHQRCNLIVFLASVDEEYKLFASRSGRGFDMSLPTSIPESVIADVKRLSQVFSALIDHAYVLSQSGRVALSVDVLSRSASSAKFCFEIECIDGSFDAALVTIMSEDFSVSLVDRVVSEYSGQMSLAVCKGLLSKMHAHLSLTNKSHSANIRLVIEFNLA